MCQIDTNNARPFYTEKNTSVQSVNFVIKDAEGMLFNDIESIVMFS